jgi:hypothetical protein
MGDFDKAASEIQILNNAIMSIQVGLQDLKIGTPAAHPVRGQKPSLGRFVAAQDAARAALTRGE